MSVALDVVGSLPLFTKPNGKAHWLFLAPQLIGLIIDPLCKIIKSSRRCIEWSRKQQVCTLGTIIAHLTYPYAGAAGINLFQDRAAAQANLASAEAKKSKHATLKTIGVGQSSRQCNCGFFNMFGVPSCLDCGSKVQTCEVWRLAETVSAGGHIVHRFHSRVSPSIGVKHANEIVFGTLTEDGSWLKLASDVGFCLVKDANTTYIEHVGACFGMHVLHYNLSDDVFEDVSDHRVKVEGSPLEVNLHVMILEVVTAMDGTIRGRIESPVSGWIPLFGKDGKTKFASPVKTVWFEADTSIGLTWSGHTSHRIVKHVKEGSPAHLLGVQEGWEGVRIGSDEFSMKLLQGKIKNKLPFDITFQMPNQFDLRFEEMDKMDSPLSFKGENSLSSKELRGKYVKEGSQEHLQGVQAGWDTIRIGNGIDGIPIYAFI